MKVLLDSHTFVWFVLGDRRCSTRARETIEDPGATVFVSAVTPWEVATKVRIGKWPEAATTIHDFSAIVMNLDFKPLPITLEHGRVAGFLAGAHRDPFDRILAAQSQIEALPLVTADPALRTFEIDTIW